MGGLALHVGGVDVLGVKVDITRPLKSSLIGTLVGVH